MKSVRLNFSTLLFISKVIIISCFLSTIQVVDISSPLRCSQPGSGSDDGHGLEVIDICSDEAVASSPSKKCYTMQFSFEELKKRRHQKLWALQASKNTPGKRNKAKG